MSTIRRNPFRPTIETLENRQLLSAGLTVASPLGHAPAAPLSAKTLAQDNTPRVVKNTAATNQVTQVLAAGIYRTQSVLSFRQTVGNFGASNLQRVRGMAFQLASDGTIRLALPDTWYSPLSGRVQRVGDSLYFRLSRNLSTGVGYNFVLVEGIIRNVNGKPQLLLYSQAGNSMAAVVNNLSFGSSVSSAYLTQVSLSRIA